MQSHKFVVQSITQELGVLYEALSMRGITERSAVVQLLSGILMFIFSFVPMQGTDFMGQYLPMQGSDKTRQN